MLEVARLSLDEPKSDAVVFPDDANQTLIDEENIDGEIMQKTYFI